MTDYYLERTIYEQTFRETPIHYAEYWILETVAPSARRGLCQSLEVPCRSNLHRLLTGLFYNWDWNDMEDKQVSEDEAMMLKHIFTSQKEYKLWKDAFEKLKSEGAEKAKAWLIEQTKVLALRNVIRGKPNG